MFVENDLSEFDEARDIIESFEHLNVNCILCVCVCLSGS
ncbi:unnamed protein product [Brassica rapa]|uniref:Uncharacterized protein n=1 Tax=Brassica campestris TaxID=3711 RepID=A0A8D9MB04_BRACM|nr:unnamed protein product [Brassica rapa]